MTPAGTHRDGPCPARAPDFSYKQLTCQARQAAISHAEQTSFVEAVVIEFETTEGDAIAGPLSR